MDQHRLLTFAKQAARFCLRSLWIVTKSYIEMLSIFAALFYIWASFGRPDIPHPHYLNWPECKAVFFEVSNHLMKRIYDEGCGQ